MVSDGGNRMALVECHECGKKISSTAPSCPSCGAKPPKKTAPLTWAVLAIIVLSIGSIMFGKSGNPPPAAPAEAEYQAAVEKGKRDRVEAFNKDRGTILASMDKLAKAGKWEEASALANNYYNVEDPAFVKQRDAIKKRLSDIIAAKAKAQAKKEGVSIGMTKEQVLASSWGKPEKINTTTNRYGSHEQWVYGSGGYLYFDNDKLTSIQN